MNFKDSLNSIKFVFSITILIIFSLFTSITISTYIKFSKSDVTFTYRYLNDDPVKQFNVSIENVPQSCIDALVSMEDRTYYSNIGVDLNGVFRYFLSSINNQNLGGSTISQQVIKNIDSTFYTNDIFTKYTEVVKAVKLNSILRKDEILEIYFNNIYLGNYNYGIESASLNYFSKSSKFLNTRECSYIIGLIQSPETLNPFVNLNKGIDMSNVVLNSMLNSNFISSNEYSTLTKEPLNIKLY